MSFKSVYEELKRRKVLKVASLYIVVSWIVIQVAATIFPQLNLPDWSVKATIFFCFIGFPLAILISWFFDVVPDEKGGIEIKNKPKNDKSLTNKKVWLILSSYTIIGLVAFGYVVAEIASDPDKEAIAFVESRLDPNKQTIAVLPFDNLSNDIDQEYFSDGLTDEIRYILSKIPNIRVISRTSCMVYKGKNFSISEISKQLNATHVLEGSVRKSGNRIRINLSLTDAIKDEMVWNLPPKNYEVKEVFDLQEFIANKVLSELKITLLAPIEEVTTKRYTDNPEVYNLYLKSQKLFNQLTPEAFVEVEKVYHQLLEMDPDFLYAQTGLVTINLLKGTIWGSISTEEAKKRANVFLENAKRIDSSSSAYHMVNGQVYFYLNYNFEKGEQEFLKAFQGGETWSPIVLSDLYIKQGKVEDSKTMTKYLKEIDPFNSALAVQEGCELFYSGQSAGAISKLEQALRFNEGYPQYFRVLAQVYLHTGQYDKALQTVQLGIDKLGFQPPFLLGTAAIANYKLKKYKEFDKIIDQLKTSYRSSVSGDLAFFIAQSYAGTDQIEQALEWLQKSHERKEVELAWLKVDPAFKSLQNEMEYQNLLDLINLGI